MSRIRVAAVVALLALGLGGAGLWLIAEAGAAQSPRHVTVGGVPLQEVHPLGLRPGERRPGVVVAHGFAGSGRLMAPFADSLAARGYVVVLLDFSGHGGQRRPLPDDTASSAASVAALDRDLDVAVTHLRTLRDVDPARIGLVGHSMGAGAVTRYAAGHADIGATVAISLPGAGPALGPRPQRLLLLVGALEFPGFHDAATTAAEHGGSDRTARTVPAVEHISILYAPRAHRETVTWLDEAFGGPFSDSPVPWPGRRATGGVLLMLAFLAAFPLVARLSLGGRPRPETIKAAHRGGNAAPTAHQTTATAEPDRSGEPSAHQTIAAAKPNESGVPLAPKTQPTAEPGKSGDPSAHQTTAAARAGGGGDGLGLVVLVAAGAVGVASVGAAVLPVERVPVALGGYFAAFGVVAGLLLVGYRLVRRGGGTAYRKSGRALVALPLLVGFGVAAIAVPLNLGVGRLSLVGARWWVLLGLWGGFALLSYGGERLGGGVRFGVPVVSGLVVVALTGAAVVGLTHGFVLLVVPVIAVLLGWQALWSRTLRGLGAPAWLIAVVGSVLVAFPLATAPPLIGV